MIEELHEECGIAGVHFFNTGNVVPLLYKMLLNLQNRGQVSAGITTYNEERKTLLQTYKDLGTVNEVFNAKDTDFVNNLIEKLSGRTGIGHVRYSTFGLLSKSYAHPFERAHGRKCKWFSFCFNGNVANFGQLKKDLLENKEYHLRYNSDTEILMHLMALELSRLFKSGELPNLQTVFKNISDKIDGAYSLAYMDAEGRLAVIRDPHGIRPLCYSIDKEKVMFASESVALENLGAKNITPIKPGEMLIVENNICSVTRYTPAKKTAHCMFEYVYFSNVASTLENRSVYQARLTLGKEMAKLETIDVNSDEYVVISVPDSSKPFGEGFAYTLGLPHVEGLVRNRFVGRTFIEGNGRSEKVENKFSLIKEVIQNKKVMLVDDSIVRGNTSRMLLEHIRTEGGAKEIHLRISCPPIICPCFYGIDMSSTSELIAHKYSKPGEDISDEMSAKLAKDLGADSLIYQKIENIPKAIGNDNLCMACLNGEYPTKNGKALYQKALGNKDDNNNGRVYE